MGPGSVSLAESGPRFRALRNATTTPDGSLTRAFTVERFCFNWWIGEGLAGGSDRWYISGRRNGDTATLRDLAGMTSGIPQLQRLGGIRVMDGSRWPGTVFTPQQLSSTSVRKEPALFPAGRQMDYSNTNTVLLGMVIETVTGQPMTQVYQAIWAAAGHVADVVPRLVAGATPTASRRGQSAGRRHARRHRLEPVVDVHRLAE